MNAVTHYMTIDLLRETVDGTVFIRNAGIGHKLSVRLTAGSRVLTLPEATEGIVQLVYKLPDGTKSDVQMTADYGDAWVMIPRAMLSVTGVVDCEVRVYLEALGTWTTSPQFTVTVQDVIYDEAAQQEIVSDPTVYEEILSSEAGRALAEQGRVSAEAARALAEEARAAAEAARVLAEEARAAAEEARIAGGAITRADVDAALSGTSVNPVQNKTIKAALDGKQDALTFDTEPTEGSPRPVKSGGVYTALTGKQGTLTFDDTPTADSANPVKSKGIYYALDAKQDTLTFDTEPTEGSPRPVKSGGIYTALQGKQDALEWDTTPTQNSTKPVTSGGIYTAIQNMTPSVITGSFTLNSQLTGATVTYSSIIQVGRIVYVRLMIDIGSGIGNQSKILGDISGVDNPASTATILPCLTKGSGANDMHFAFATIGLGAIAVKSSESTDQYVYIETCYQAAV